MPSHERAKSEAELLHPQPEAARADLEPGGDRVDVVAELGDARGDLVALELLRLADPWTARDQRVEVGPGDAERGGGAAELEAVLAQRGDQAIVVDRGTVAPRRVGGIGGFVQIVRVVR